MVARPPQKLFTLLMAALFLAACAPGAATPAADAVATIVAATLAAGEAPEATATLETAAPTEEPLGSYGDCANSGQPSVAYLKEGNVWLWTQGGEAVALTDSGDVDDLRISDDGCRVAYARRVANPTFDPDSDFPTPDTLNELWIVHSDASSQQQLAGLDFFATLPDPNGQGIGLYQFEWQPGSHRLAFSTQALTYGLAQSNDIHLVQADSAALSTLLPGGEGGDFYFSPDGSQLAFSTHSSISAINTDGSNLRTNLLEYEMVITFSEYLYYATPVWGPDGDELMVAIPPADGLAPPENGVYTETALWYIPLDGTPPFEAGAIQNVWFAQSAVGFAPDIGRIAYLRPLGQPEENRQELVLALSNGSNESATIEQPGIRIGAWSPDSSQLLYWYPAAGGQPQIYRLNAADGSSIAADSLTQFQANGAYFQWAWPDGYVQARQRDADGFVELSLINLDGSGTVIDAYPSQQSLFDLTP